MPSAACRLVNRKSEMMPIIELMNEYLPQNKPRYLMGVGTPADIVRGIGRGIDMFDCVLPTRNARNGSVFTRHGTMIGQVGGLFLRLSPH